MKEPTTEEEIVALQEILRSNPQRYLQITNSWIGQDPTSATAYFDRHFAWMHLDEPKRALDDLSKSIELEPSSISFWSRGDVHRSQQAGAEGRRKRRERSPHVTASPRAACAA